jgi:AAA domain/Bifunctional DNA primase/polymerase, N-terminal/Primase C terminal 1 (PriCT-1)
VKTGRGTHLHFLANKPLRSRFIEPGLELKGEGGSATLPPSRHASGAIYVLLNDLEPARLPEWIAQLASEYRASPATGGNGEAEIPEGARHNRLVKLAGAMRWQGCGELEILAALREVNERRCKPRLATSEIEQIARDVSGRYAAGNANAATPATPATEKVTSKICTWDEIPNALEWAATPVAWAVADMIPIGAITLITGEPGVYKTWLALLLALGVSRGTSWLNQRCTQLDALYLDRENPLAVVQDRLGLLGADGLPHMKVWGLWLPDEPPMIGDSRLLEIARGRKPLMILDSMIRFHVANENAADEMAGVMAHVRKLATAGATPILFHHRGRSESARYRGSSDILAAVDVAYSITREYSSGLLRLSAFKNRFGPQLEITLRPDLEGQGGFQVTQSPNVVREEEQISRLKELVESEPGITKTKLIERSGLPQRRAAKLLDHGVGRHWLAVPGLHRSMRYYQVKPSAEQVEMDL